MAVPTYKECPRCGKAAESRREVLAIFGYRHNEEYRADESNGPTRLYLQPWCKDCRNVSGRNPKIVVKKLPTDLQALRRLYRAKTGDTKNRSKADMLTRFKVAK